MHGEIWNISTHLFIGLEYITLEHVGLTISGNVTPNLQVLWVVGHIEYAEIKEWE